MAAEVLEPCDLQCQYIMITTLYTVPATPFPSQPKELVRIIIGALLSLQLTTPPPFFLPALPSPRHMSPTLGREKSEGVERERQDVLENEMNIYQASTMFRQCRAFQIYQNAKQPCTQVLFLQFDGQKTEAQRAWTSCPWSPRQFVPDSGRLNCTASADFTDWFRLLQGLQAQS